MGTPSYTAYLDLFNQEISKNPPQLWSGLLDQIRISIESGAISISFSNALDDSSIAAAIQGKSYILYSGSVEIPAIDPGPEGYSARNLAEAARNADSSRFYMLADTPAARALIVEDAVVRDVVNGLYDLQLQNLELGSSEYFMLDDERQIVLDALDKVGDRALSQRGAAQAKGEAFAFTERGAQGRDRRCLPPCGAIRLAQVQGANLLRPTRRF